MSYLIVITFDDADEAGKVRESLAQSDIRNQVSLDDSAVILKNADGKVQVKNEIDRGVKVGAAGGGLLGLFVGFMFGGPIGAAVVGAAGGAVVGSLSDLGIQKSFVKEVTESLTPDSSALFLIIRDANPNVVVAALRPYKGEVYHTSLPTEAEETLRRVLKQRS